MSTAHDRDPPPATTTSSTRNAASSASGTCRTPPPSPRSACTPCSIAARRRPASSPSTAAISTPIAAWAWSATISATQAVIAALPGYSAIGHNRYATTGDTVLRNVQPIYRRFRVRRLRAGPQRQPDQRPRAAPELVRRGCLFQSTTDTEVIIHLIALSHYSTVVDRLIDALKQVEGAYSLVALTNEALIGVRDPLGVRPLVLGRIGSTARRLGAGLARPARSTSSAPSSCATSSRARSSSSTTRACTASSPSAARRDRFCVFEYIYFARPDFDDRGHRRLRGAQAHRRRAGARERACRPTWSCRCPIPACRRRSATRRRAASRSSSASSATTMSAAPSSSRPTTSAISA